MCKLLHWVVVFAILLNSTATAAYGQNYAFVDDGVAQGHFERGNYWSRLSPRPHIDSMQVQMTFDGLGIVEARLPFAASDGRIFELRLNYASQRFEIWNSLGSLEHSGAATASELAALLPFVVDLTLPTGQRTLQSPNAKNLFLAITGVVLAGVGLGFAIASYIQAERAAGIAGDAALRQCAGDMLRDSVAARAARTSCPMGITRVTSDGRFCTQVPRTTPASPGSCVGELFAGCIEICE